MTTASNITFADLKRFRAAWPGLSWQQIGGIVGVPRLAGAETPGGGGEAAVQPGSGDGGGVEGLYQQVLGDFPEELRPYAEQSLKKWEQGVTPKLMAAAELQKKYEPFEGVEGLTDVDPEELKQLIGFRDTLGDEDRFLGWLSNVNEAMGIPTLDSLDQESWQQMGEANGWLDGFEDGEGEGEGQGSAIAAQVAELAEGLQAIQQVLAAQHQQSQQREQLDGITNKMAADLAALHEQHGDFDEDHVLALAHAHLGDPDAVLKAFEHFQKIRGQADGERVDRQLGQPNPALNGGRPDTQPPKFDGLDDPALRQAAMSRFQT